ncbi:hypothetical protein [Vibrio aestuarianus]|uniref:hypothetical protein n=1 Tax=Vibrio aestuarianus TaxID=28171 RepID=UPI0015930CBD|nr:hypothetical protein [Vibrio aestuarianus]MDE1247919.1 hypothetical protein [Vibrio aestuarianus]NGZ65141.1 hypothetical protein [Vibrio aestuarianus subsp. cardii]
MQRLGQCVVHHLIGRYALGGDLEISEVFIRRKSKLNALKTNELESIIEFQKRALQFETAMKRYYIGAIAKHQISDDYNVKKSTFVANTPDAEHIENLALKFRFFYADKEKTKVEKIINLLRQSVQDDWAKSYLDRLRAQYNGIMNRSDMSGQMGHPVTNREVINLWFNSEFFHSDLGKRRKLESINEIISDKVSLFQLYTAISGISSQINSLYAVVHKVSSEHGYIYTPDHNFSRDKKVQA